MLIDRKLNILSIYIFNMLNTWILNVHTFDILDTFDMLIWITDVSHTEVRLIVWLISVNVFVFI